MLPGLVFVDAKVAFFVFVELDYLNAVNSIKFLVNFSINWWCLIYTLLLLDTVAVVARRVYLYAGYLRVN